MQKMLFLFNPRSGKAQLKNHLLEIIDIFTKAGYEVYFALLKETAIGDWSKFRSKFGY